jgi:hypothetical protein
MKDAVVLARIDASCWPKVELVDAAFELERWLSTAGLPLKPEVQ